MAIPIKHVSIKVGNLERARAFYEEVFGYKHLRTVSTTGFDGPHFSCHMTDGIIDLTLLYYEEQIKSGDPKGAEPVIHHFGVEVEDLEAFTRKLKNCGGEVLSAPGDVRVKFKMPSVPMLEIVPAGRWTKSIKALNMADTADT